MASPGCSHRTYGRPSPLLIKAWPIPACFQTVTRQATAVAASLIAAVATSLIAAALAVAVAAYKAPVLGAAAVYCVEGWRRGILQACC